MKTKFNSMWRVAIALVMALSLGLVMAVPATPVAANGLPPSPLVVAITQPADGTKYHVSQTYNVTATVKNTGASNVASVVATLTFGANAGLVEGDNAAKTLGDISAGATQEANWTLHCKGEDTGTNTTEITVTAVGSPGPGGSATKHVKQLHVEKLGLTNTAPAKNSEIGVGTTFPVSATVSNDGYAGMNLVSATLAIGPNVYSAGTAAFTQGNAAVVGTSTSWTSTMVGGTIKHNTDNIWCKILSVTDATHLTLTASYTGAGGTAAYTINYGHATIVSPGATQNLGPIAQDGQVIVTWQVQCTGADDPLNTNNFTDNPKTTFSVTATGKGGKTGATIDVGPCVTTVEQKYIIVVITQPQDGQNFNACMEFYVGATIYNYHPEPLLGNANVTLTIADSDPSSPPATQIITAAIPGNGGSATVPNLWHLHCLASGDTDITVTAVGITTTSRVTLANDKKITVHQQTPAQLTATVAGLSPCIGQNQAAETHITATITNNGQATATSVTATLALTGNATVDEALTWTVGTGTLTTGASENVIWHLRCTGAGNVTVRVTPAGIDANTTQAIVPAKIVASALQTVKQLPLKVVITGPADGTTYSVCQTFCVTATIQDLAGAGWAPSIIATIGNGAGFGTTWELAAGETAAKTIASVGQGQTQEVSWTVHCKGSGDATFQVKAATTWDGCEQDTRSQTVTVHQKTPRDLTVEILSPVKGGITLGSSEDATAAWSTTWAHSGSKSVYLSVPTGATTASYADLEFPVNIKLVDIVLANTSYWVKSTAGTGIPYLMFELDNNENTRISAYAPASTGFVDVWAKYDASSGAGSWQDIDGSSHTFAEIQASNSTAIVTSVLIENSEIGPSYVASAYIDDITVNGASYPLEDVNTYVATSQDFAVTATIKNTGEATSLNTVVKIAFAPVGSASVVSPGTAEVNLGDLAKDASKTQTWTVHCDKSGTTTISVTATGTDQYSNDRSSFGPATVAVNQYPAASLKVNIAGNPATVKVGDEFDITSTVTNTGEADASEVALTLSVVPEGSVRVREGGYTQTVGTLAGHGQSGSATVTWKLVCKVVSNSTITVTPSGRDEFGWHLKQDPATGATILVSMPGSAIQSTSLKPKSVTVKQLESSGLDLGVTKAVDKLHPAKDETINFTVRVTNYGPTNASGVTVNETLPSGLSNWSVVSITQGQYLTGVWTVGNVVVGASATLVLSAQVGSTNAITNTASVSCDQPDGNPLNDTDSATINSSLAIHLGQGWNFISWPLIPNEPKIKPVGGEGTGVLKDLVPLLTNVEIVWGDYDAVAGTWKSYDPEALSNTLTAMNDGVGFWIDMLTSGKAINIVGTEQPSPPATPRVYQVFGGGVGGYWNLIGFKSTTPKAPTDYLAGIAAGKYTMIYGYDNPSGYFVVGTPAHPNLEPGHAYWIAVLQSGNIFP